MIYTQYVRERLNPMAKEKSLKPKGADAFVPMRFPSFRTPLSQGRKVRIGEVAC